MLKRLFCVALSLFLAGCATQQSATPSGLKSTNAPPLPFTLTARPLFSSATPSVTLQWNRVNDSTVIGYKIWQGNVPGLYTNTVNAGNNTNVTIQNLVQSNTYWFAVTSYRTNIESNFSVPISYTVPFPNVATNVVAVVNFFGEASTSNQFTGWSAITNATIYWTNPPSPIFFRARMTIDYITGQP